MPIRGTYERVQAAFSGTAELAQVVVRADHRAREPRSHAGIKSTAGVVTSAALVMVAVFSIFATLGAIELEQMGVGLAPAILIRQIRRDDRARGLLPATMALLGDRNRYLPRRLSTVAQMRWSVRPAR